MAYRSQTQASPRELAFRVLLDPRATAPANELQPAETHADCAEPEEADHFLRWLRVSFGCETG